MQVYQCGFLAELKDPEIVSFFLQKKYYYNSCTFLAENSALRGEDLRKLYLQYEHKTEGVDYMYEEIVCCIIRHINCPQGLINNWKTVVYERNVELSIFALSHAIRRFPQELIEELMTKKPHFLALNSFIPIELARRLVDLGDYKIALDLAKVTPYPEIKELLSNMYCPPPKTKWDWKSDCINRMLKTNQNTIEKIDKELKEADRQRDNGCFLQWEQVKNPTRNTRVNWDRICPKSVREFYINRTTDRNFLDEWIKQPDISEKEAEAFFNRDFITEDIVREALKNPTLKSSLDNLIKNRREYLETHHYLKKALDIINASDAIEKPEEPKYYNTYLDLDDLMQ